MRSITLMLLGISLIAVTGCASTSGQNEQQVSLLQGQIAQMDAALRTQEERNRTLEAELQALRSGGAVANVPYAGATYRTPSGLEIPAVDIQKALKGAGYYAGSVDGKIGPESREAIRNFQRDNGLTADGVCGKQTWTKLKTYL